LGTTGGTEAAAPVGSQTFVVTGAGFATDITALPFGVSVVTEREIRESGVTSVNEAMTKLLGVPGRMDLSDGSNATLDLRGFGVTTDSNQVVIVDGVRLSEGDQSAPRLASLPIHTIERIEVLRGAGTVLSPNAVAVIYSLGANAATGGMSQDEAQNPNPNSADNDRAFVSRVRGAPGAAGAEFDDLLTWLSPNVLYSRLVMAGQLP
jgi:iron complex outermembrane receptor protein